MFLKNKLKEEFLFFFFLIFTVLLSILYPSKVPEYVNYVDYPTIRALVGLLLITLAIKDSNFFDWLSVEIIKRIHNERLLVLVLVIFSVFLSMFITNDITLFVIVPITMALGKYIKDSIPKVIIFEAIAVNVGSTLTPIGNPQNIFIYRNWDHGFLHFIKEMFPLFLIMFFVLLAFIFFLFKNKKIDVEIQEKKDVDRFLFLSSLVLFIIFIVAMDLHLVRYVLLFIILFYGFFYRDVFLKFDYFLIFTFVLMFIDFRILSEIDFIRNFIESFDLNSFFVVFNITVFASQVMSNVPATIFMSHFSNDFYPIACGSNIAGNGLLIASMANIIALRFLKNSYVYILFHKYSIPFFVVSYVLFSIFVFLK